MGKQILLARPHPFIVSEMKPWLEQAGYSTVKPDSIDHIANLARDSAGAIISLAASSSVSASAAEILGLLRQLKPSLPIMFAALRPFSQTGPEIERLLQSVGVAGTIASLDSNIAGITGLGSGRAFLYVSKDDVADTARATKAKGLLTRHFI
jgi:hypothetical protein